MILPDAIETSIGSKWNAPPRETQRRVSRQHAGQRSVGVVVFADAASRKVRSPKGHSLLTTMLPFGARTRSEGGSVGVVDQRVCAARLAGKDGDCVSPSPDGPTPEAR